MFDWADTVLFESTGGAPVVPPHVFQLYEKGQYHSEGAPVLRTVPLRERKGLDCGFDPKAHGHIRLWRVNAAVRDQRKRTGKVQTVRVVFTCTDHDGAAIGRACGVDLDLDSDGTVYRALQQIVYNSSEDMDLKLAHLSYLDFQNRVQHKHAFVYDKEVYAELSQLRERLKRPNLPLCVKAEVAFARPQGDKGSWYDQNANAANKAAFFDWCGKAHPSK
jgi:hypothetical protein